MKTQQGSGSTQGIISSGAGDHHKLFVILLLVMERTDTKSFEELKPNPKNPRRMSDHEGQALKRSLVDFGDLGGIVFNTRSQQLVGGHMRTSTFEKLPAQKQIYITQRFDPPTRSGTTAVGYVIVDGELFGYREVDWDEGREAAANIAPNRIMGEFNLDLLAEINYGIMQMEGGEDLLAMSGQTPGEVNSLLDSYGNGGVSNPADDVAPEADNTQPATSQLGEIYQLGKHRLMCGSATDFGQVSDLLNGANVDLVYTDPPYGIDIVGNNGQVGAGNLAVNKVYAKVEGDGDIETAKSFYKLCQDLDIKRMIFWGGNYFLSFLPASDGWLVWDKRGDMNGNNFADGEMAWCSFHTPVRIYKQIWNGMIREGEKEVRVHPTQKPVEMLSKVLADFSERGQNIFDGFGGSGSTLIACEKMSRVCYMMELSPAYCDVIRKRYAKFIGREADWQEATPIVQQAEPTPTTAD